MLLQVYSFQRRFSNVRNPFTREDNITSSVFHPCNCFADWIDLLSRYILKFLRDYLGGHLLTVCINKLSAVWPMKSAKNLCMIQMRREQKTIYLSPVPTHSMSRIEDRAYSSFKSFSIKAFKNFLFYLLLIKY